MLLWCLLVSQVEEQYAGEGTDQEDDVKPAVIEVELKLAEDFCDYGAVFWGHAHSDQQYRGHKVHSLQSRANKFRSHSGLRGRPVRTLSYLLGLEREPSG